MSRTPLVPPPPQTDDENLQPEYGHLTDAYFQRSLKKQLDLHGEDLDEAIGDFAHPVIWKRAAPCPNVTIQRGGVPKHNFGCPVCDDRKYFYWEEHGRGEGEDQFNVAVQSVNPQQQFFMLGRFISGMARITFPSGFMPNYWDRIVLKGESMLFSELVAVPQGSPFTTLRYEPQRILSAFSYIDKANWPLPTLPPGSPEDTKALYPIDTSMLRIERDSRKLYFASVPPNMDSFVVVYYMHPEFVILDLENVSRFTGSDDTERPGWPITAIGRLDFFVRGDDQSDQPLEYDEGKAFIETMGNPR